MEEVWKDIIGYEGLYKVSNLGRVKSLERIQILPNGSIRLKKERILNPKIHNGSPYYQVSLYDMEMNVKTKKIHWLVAEAFIPNPYHLPIIHHINLNKEDNCVNNLRWETYSENSKGYNRKQRCRKKRKIILNLTRNKRYYSIEKWKLIQGINVRYLVSNYGKILSQKKKKWNLLSQHIDKKGYYKVKLSLKNGTKNFLVHRLVAELFIPNPNHLPQVNHIDGNKINNCKNNLEWCTNQDNQIHAIKNGLKASGKKLPSSISLNQYSLEMELIKQWESINQCSKELGLNYGRLRKCLETHSPYANYFWEIKRGEE